MFVLAALNQNVVTTVEDPFAAMVAVSWVNLSPVELQETAHGTHAVIPFGRWLAYIIISVLILNQSSPGRSLSPWLLAVHIGGQDSEKTRKLDDEKSLERCAGSINAPSCSILVSPKPQTTG